MGIGHGKKFNYVINVIAPIVADYRMIEWKESLAPIGYTNQGVFKCLFEAFFLCRKAYSHLANDAIVTCACAI